MTTVLVIVPVWIAIGLVVSLVLGRRGHNPFGWLVLGTLLGPMAIVLAVDSRLHGEQLAPSPVATAYASASEGPVDALVGYDGSPESEAALVAAVELLGPRLGRLTLATVVPFDGGAQDERSARAALHAQTDRLSWLAPSFEVLHGKPASALLARAVDGHYGLVVAGARGAGRARLFGSAAAELGRSNQVPVLLVGAALPAVARSAHACSMGVVEGPVWMRPNTRHRRWFE